AILGIGAAWHEEEHRGYGFDFPPVRERLDRLEEALQVCRAMFTQEAPSFQGRYYQIHEVLNMPRPLQAGGPAIMVGGSGELRTLRLVAQYADMCNVIGGVEFVRHKMQVLLRYCEGIGRNPAEIIKTRLGALVVAPTRAEAESKAAEYRAARGMDEARFRSYVTAGDPEGVVQQVQEYFDAGLDGMIFNMPFVHDLDSVKLAGETLSTRFS
ncbi:MAG: LLM class flavin-dependent oxidoreductase, partial [Candidatus Tectomicrobia bacterium]|nr:LLM class flavin-dependent oxidoreductase [Candidatus Tectomicrobia bacterium]